MNADEIANEVADVQDALTTGARLLDDLSVGEGVPDKVRKELRRALGQVDNAIAILELSWN